MERRYANLKHYHNPLVVMQGSSKVTFTHDGTDLNIEGTSTTDINITGISGFNVGNYAFDIDQTVGAGQDNYVLTYDDATGTISLEAAAGGGGDVTKVGTPVNDQIGVWTGDGTIEGDANLTYSSVDDRLTIGAGGHGIGLGSLSNRTAIYNGSGDNLLEFTDTDGGVIIINEATLRIAAGNTLAIWGTGDRAELSVDANGYLQFGFDNNMEGVVFQYPCSIESQSLPPTAVTGANTIFAISKGGPSEPYVMQDGGRSHPIANVRERVWRFHQTLTASDPGTNFLRVDTEDMSTFTEIYADDTDYANEDAGWFWNMAAVGDTLLMHQSSDEDAWAHVRIDSITDNTGWWTIGVTVLDYGRSGANTHFEHADPITLSLERTSLADITSSGTTGGTGSAGSGNQYVELTIGGTTYKLLHDGTV